ncbi:MAG: hypothetical protein FWF71_02335 [Actinomycetia bacterium]|nr:hypothetical protein [Actinomycetes bacterium]
MPGQPKAKPTAAPSAARRCRATTRGQAGGAGGHWTWAARNVSESEFEVFSPKGNRP